MNRQPKQALNKSRKVCIALVIAAIPLAAAGCGGGERFTDYESFVSEPRAGVSLKEYLVEPPDEIRIESKRVRELADHAERIRPDGYITPPLIGNVFIAGKTCDQISAEMETLARKYYDDADITVRVSGFYSKKIYVFGEVFSPGPYPYNGANSILGTLAAAQPTRLADPSRIQIVRPNKDGDLVRRMTVSVDSMIQEGNTSLDAVLESGDIIYVPPNSLASVGLALQQLLLPIQPAAATVSGPADIEETTQGTTYGRKGG
jgi:polysaccharide export outer membrane protein